jgi:hypothetical protein
MGCLGAHYVNVDRIIMNNELEGVWKEAVVA